MAQFTGLQGVEIFVGLQPSLGYLTHHKGDDLFQNGCIEALGQTHSQCHGLYGIGCYFTGYFIGPLDHNGGCQRINFNLMILIHSGSQLKIQDSSRNFT